MQGLGEKSRSTCEFSLGPRQITGETGGSAEVLLVGWMKEREQNVFSGCTL